MIANVNVLVVDDEEVVRRSHLRVLSGKRCHVEAVDDGEKALKAMEAKRYDVVLLDLRMPGIDGMSVLRTMRERWPESEVIISQAPLRVWPGGMARAACSTRR